MSGPKGGYYTVETPAQIEARRLRAAREDYARAEQQWASAAAKMVAATAIDGTAVNHHRPAAAPRGADPSTLAAAAEELRRAAASAAGLAEAVRRRASEEQHRSQLARLIEHVALEDASESRSARPSRWEAANRPGTPSSPKPAVDRERAQRRVRPRLDALAALDHDPALVASLITDISDARSDERVDLLVAELDFVVTRAREAADHDTRVRDTRAELFALQAALTAITGTEANRLRKRIADAVDAFSSDTPDDLAAAVRTLIAESDAEADRVHVVQVMNAALLELGYATGPEFSTGLSGVPATGFARRGTSNYGIKLRLEPGTRRFTAQAVKSDAALTSAEEDAAAERAFCDVMERITEVAERDGVVLDLDIRTAPGVYAVQSVAAATLPSTTAASTSRANGTRHREQGVG